MKKQWDIPDLIDLEYLMPGDSDVESGAPPRKTNDTISDREIYIEFSKSRQPPFSRREMIRYWLDRRRDLETAGNGPGALPGNTFSEALRLIRLIIVIAGCSLGASLAWSLLDYKGVSPINIFTCLWVLIIPQLLLLLTLVTLILYRRLNPGPSAASGYPLLTGLIRRLMTRIQHAAASRLSAGRRNQMQAAIGRIGRHQSVYGGVFFWPVFILAQTFGVCFNTGALAAAFIRITITDLAFGWQSTLQLDPAAVYKIIKTISLPWSRLVPASVAHPTIAQIEGSKMVLKDGIFHLTTQNMVSWWPFLCLALLFYGFLPRLLLLAIGFFSKRRSLARLTFNHAACDRLLHRMETPEINTVNRDTPSTLPKSHKENPAFDQNRTPAAPTPAASMDAIAVIPEELAGIYKPDNIDGRISDTFGYKVKERMISQGIPGSDTSRLKEMIRAMTTGTGSSCRIVILFEAWQPPIKETLSWISAIREAVGVTTGMVIALAGHPATDAALTPPADTDFTIWQQTIAGLGDPYLRVEKL